MRSSRQLALIAVFLLQLLSAFADEVITNVMSPVVSYQFYDSLNGDTNSVIISPVVSYQFYDSLVHAGTNAFIISPVASYQYFDWPDAASVNFLNSPNVSYYYQFANAPQLAITYTKRTPTTPEITPTIILPSPYPWQLKTFTNGLLTTNVPPDPNRMTIVLTHGWKSNPDAWATNMARLISQNVATPPNILVWDWSSVADSTLCDANQFAASARQTPDQGIALALALRSKLGINYSQQIHFIGHSLGTLINGWAAIFLHNRGYSPTNTHMTLLDEAEVATDLSCTELLKAVLLNQWNPLAPKPYYYQPLPKKFAWADNYISAFGLLHPDAHNVILTNGMGSIGNLVAFHSYPCSWYAETISADISAMGHRWSFERGGFAGAPTTNTVFLQSANGSLWNLAQTDYVSGSNYLNGRFQKYRDALAYAITRRTPDSAEANGAVQGELMATGPLNAFNSIIFSLLTRHGTSQSPQFRAFGVHPNDAGGSGGSGNVGAYAWLPLPIPADAVSMSFDFRVEGDWQDDSLAAALNGTNVLLLVGSQVETNVTVNSGLIDVSTYAGHTNEFFVGIIGGTSSNALVTVENLVFYTAAPPSLQAEVSGSKLKVSWPFTSLNFNLESTTNLTTTNSWTAVTNVPAVVDLQNTVTNPISGGAKFYRLKK